MFIGSRIAFRFCEYIYVTMLGNFQFRPLKFTLLVAVFFSFSVGAFYYMLNQHKTINASYPIVVNTWGFTNANRYAWGALVNHKSALDAVETGCMTCEREQCDGTVGFGGSPDELGETTLDAMIMDGMTMNAGAVGALRNIKNAVSVARHVLEHTGHTLLVGNQASNFAVEMGFKEESLSTTSSEQIWNKWKTRNCQPNFRTDVIPDPTTSCGPYKPIKVQTSPENHNIVIDQNNHDTIGIVAIDEAGNIAAATSTNGARYKIPGRVGDSPIIGSGAYAEKDVGAAAATGDGDIMMRFLPSFKAVESLKIGLSPKSSAESSLRNIIKFYPKFSGGIIVVRADGEYAAACHGLKSFPFTVSNSDLDNVATVFTTDCITV